MIDQNRMNRDVVYARFSFASRSIDNADQFSTMFDLLAPLLTETNIGISSPSSSSTTSVRIKKNRCVAPERYTYETTKE
uniref:Uncharacterized protein n=1 Tax=Romanomermis culicivorax TaxID=13658 RepID=A0A915IZ43_ROMCU